MKRIQNTPPGRRPPPAEGQADFSWAIPSGKGTGSGAENESASAAENGDILVRVLPDGGVQISGPSVAEIGRRLFGRPGALGPPLVDDALGVTYLVPVQVEKATPMGADPQDGRARDENLEAANLAHRRLTEFLDTHRSFKTSAALEAFAGAPVPPLDAEGRPNPQYHSIWARVRRAINDYAETHHIPYRKTRIGRGTVFEFLPENAQRTQGAAPLVRERQRAEKRKGAG